MADKRAYFHVDVGYFDNPKLAPLVEDHPRAVILHQVCIAYAAQHLTDGLVPMRLAMRRACAEQCHLDLLLQCGLLIAADRGNVEVHDYLKHQRSSEEVKHASDKARKGATARWADASSNAVSMPDAMPDAMPREKERKKEKEGATATRFEEFWKVYPIKKGKAEAEKAYAKQIKAGTTHEQIMAGLATYVRLLATPGAPSPKYAQGWLNGKRWEDEDATTNVTPIGDPFRQYRTPAAPDPESLPWVTHG